MSGKDSGENAAIANAQVKLSHIESAARFDNAVSEAFGAIVELSLFSREWAADFAGRLGSYPVVLGDFAAEDDEKPVRVWVPYTHAVDGESVKRDGYITANGKDRELFSVSSIGDECCVTPDDAMYADLAWASGGVLLHPDLEKVGVPTLVTPELYLTDELVNEALRRHFLAPAVSS